MRAVYFQWQCLCDAGVRWGDGDRVYRVDTYCCFFVSLVEQSMLLKLSHFSYNAMDCLSMLQLILSGQGLLVQKEEGEEIIYISCDLHMEHLA